MYAIEIDELLIEQWLISFIQAKLTSLDNIKQ